VPSDLTTRRGLVIGHPDRKKDFAVQVSFTRDTPLPSGQWSIPKRQGSQQQFIFALPDVQLIPIFGGLNRGMSGGPLVVDGTVIGVFSGGEEPSGGGFGWAISVDHFATLTLARPRMAVSELPPLRLLVPGSSPLVPLKRAESPVGRRLHEQRLLVDANATQLGALAAAIREDQRVVRQCVEEGLPLSLPVGDAIAKATKCLAAIDVVFGKVQTFQGHVAEIEKAMEEFGRVSNPLIRERGRRVSPAEALSDDFKQYLDEAQALCSRPFAPDLKTRNETIKSRAQEALKALTAVKAAYRSPALSDGERFERMRPHVLTYFRDVRHLNDEIVPFSEYLSLHVLALNQCLEAVIRVVEFRI
jgi:hypothetical protein